MAGENIWSWSTTAANNGNADTSINWVEGQARASVNNSARSEMASIAKWRDLSNGSIITGGSANAQTFTSGVGFSGTVPTGMRVLLKIGPTLTNTDIATLEMDGLGPSTIKYPGGTDLGAAALVASSFAEFVYDGTYWILLAAVPLEQPVPSALVLISTQTASGASSLNFTTGIDSTYNEYLFILTDVWSSAAPMLGIRISTDGGATWKQGATDYKRALNFTTYSTSVEVTGTTNQTFMDVSFLGDTATHVTSGQVRLHGPSNSASVHAFRTQTETFTSAGELYMIDTVSAYVAGSGPINAVTFFPASGTLNGTISLYGMTK